MSLESVKRDALDEGVDVVWRDITFRVPPPDDWLLGYAHYVERDQLTLALEEMLGPEQYERFRTSTPRPKMSEIEPLLNQALSRFGLKPGES